MRQNLFYVMAVLHHGLFQFTPALQYADTLLKLKPKGETLRNIYFMQMAIFNFLKENKKLKQVFAAVKLHFQQIQKLRGPIS